MSLKTALIEIQQEKKEKEISVKIQAMVDEQKLLLAIAENEKCNTDGKSTGNKPSKEWQPDILTKGGISYYTLNGKKYKVSVCNNDNDIILKFKIKTALDKTLSVSAKTLKGAQSVIDDLFGKGKYIVSACCL